MELNKIYVESNLDTTARMPNDSINLTLTSPPYDKIRLYKGYSFDFEALGRELYRITTKGGILVWIVGDQTIGGSETGTSFRQALYLMECGFRLHDTMIFEKNSSSFPAKRTGNRYTQIFEYMFVFSKGAPTTCNLLCDKPNKWAGFTNWGKNTQYNPNGELILTNDIKPIPEFSPRNNIWKYTVGFNDKTSHPAVFPEKLVEDHILTWTNPGDLVYDPFMGSGTVGKMCVLNNRNYIGSEISPEYTAEAEARIAKYASKKIQDYLISGYEIKFNEIDSHGRLFTKESINLDDFDQMKIRGQILDYEIDDKGVKIVKNLKLESFSI